MSRSRLIQYFLIGKNNPIVCIFINNDSVTDDAKYISSCKKLDACILFKMILFLNWYSYKKLCVTKVKLNPTSICTLRSRLYVLNFSLANNIKLIPHILQIFIGNRIKTNCLNLCNAI